jgi:hypothetical protein
MSWPQSKVASRGNGGKTKLDAPGGPMRPRQNATPPTDCEASMPQAA